MKNDEEMLARLKENARADYAGIRADSFFATKNLEALALKITVCKTFLDSIEGFRPGFPHETMAFLCYEKPITRLYEGFMRRDYDMTDIFAETMSELSVEMTHEVREMLEQPEAQEDNYDLER